jgi:hypothetical protein
MDTPQQALSAVIREALAERGVVTLRAAADATSLSKDAIKRRYDGKVAWTYPDDIAQVCKFLELPASELVARAEKRRAA